MVCRNCCHLGRIGEYPEMIAERGMAAVMFVNTHGGGTHLGRHDFCEQRNHRAVVKPEDHREPQRELHPLIERAVFPQQHALHSDRPDQDAGQRCHYAQLDQQCDEERFHSQLL
jgi:hypothetical protein